MNTAEKKIFNVFRIIGLTALICTFVLWAGLWISSGIPSNKQFNTSIADSVDSSLDINNTMSATNVTSYISFAFEEGSTHYIDDTTKIIVNYYPLTTTDREVEYSSSNTSVATVDQNGIITFWGKGLTKIEVKLKSNPNISCEKSCYGWGINPAKKNDNTLHIGYTYEATPRDQVRLYETGHAWVNDGQTDMHSVYKYYTEDENIATVDLSGIVTGRGLGETTLYAEFKDGTILSQSIKVVKNDDYQKLEKINLKDFTLDVETFYFRISDLIDSFEPSPQGNYKPVIHVASSDKTIVHEQNSQLVVVGYGEVTLTFYSEFDIDETTGKHIHATVTTYVEPIRPTALRISAPNTITPHVSTYLTASHAPSAYSSAVEWSVVSGNATITEKGELVATFWGDVVVRCTSTINPDLYVEKTIPCVPFSNAYYFVRKIMGHFGLSALLGFGIFYTIFLLDKRKWTAFVATPVLSFGYAAISEIIQYFTPTRLCALTDVLIDFIGALIGMAVAMVVLAIIALVWRLTGKKNFNAFSSAMNSLNLRNALHKAYVADEYHRESHCDIPQQNINTIAS